LLWFYDKTSLSIFYVTGSNSDSKSNTNYKIIQWFIFSSKHQSFYNGLGKNLSFQADAGLEHKIDDKGQLISFAASFQNSNNENNSDIKETTSTSFGNDVSNKTPKNRTILLKIWLWITNWWKIKIRSWIKVWCK
jgi:hypothetical protein